MDQIAATPRGTGEVGGLADHQLEGTACFQTTRMGGGRVIRTRTASVNGRVAHEHGDALAVSVGVAVGTVAAVIGGGAAVRLGDPGAGPTRPKTSSWTSPRTCGSSRAAPAVTMSGIPVGGRVRVGAVHRRPAETHLRPNALARPGEGIDEVAQDVGRA
ncbi:MAG: hypothetical protein IPM08_00840 [Actinomycetales bacterium]|nr:hypothetical protein [Actinomycetales bacterium]